MQIVRCISCEGYGWFEEDDGSTSDCDWCGGAGYVYRDEGGVDHKIPAADYGRVAATLEQLEIQRYGLHRPAQKALGTGHSTQRLTR